MAGPVAFVILAFIGSLSALVGVYGVTGLQVRARGDGQRYPSLG